MPGPRWWSMSEIYIIGIDGSELPARHKELLRRCSLILTSSRLAAFVGDSLAEVRPITPLDQAFTKIAEVIPSGNIAVLASGDPLFFGIGTRIIERFGRERVRVFPALSSLQQAFARFGMGWHDAAVVSLHGRTAQHIPGLLLARRKTFIFTDRRHSPNRIAASILEYLHLIGEENIRKNCRLHVAENLGSAQEKISSGSLDEIAGMRCGDLNVLCVLLPEIPERPVFGLYEDEISHSRGLITKDEVRAATLHRLRLPRRGVFWDIGGGSGSISMEAAAMHRELEVYTVEHNGAELENIKENIRRFSLFNIIPVAGRAADMIGALPDPDAVFVGGSGGELESIIRESASRLHKGGRLIVNGVTARTTEEAPALMGAQGMTVTSSTIEVTRTGPDGPLGFNPITIMVGRK